MLPFRVSPSLRCLCGVILSLALGTSLADEASAPKLPKILKQRRDADWYPDALRLKQQEGRVLVEFQISPEGQAVKVDIVSSEPRRAFDSVAKRCCGESYMTSPEIGAILWSERP